MRIAVLQFAAGDDKPANLDRLTRLVEQAADAGASLVVAPEAAMHGFGDPAVPLAAVAEPLDGEFVTGVAAVAARRQVSVVAGMFESSHDDPERAWNTVVAVGADGELRGSYRKQHLFDALGWTESARLLPGAPEDRLVLDCGELRVGVMTCYDLRFPELARALVDDGATLLAVPAAWVAGPLKEQQWSTLAVARAIEGVCWLAGAAQPPPTYSGRSCVVDPFGIVVASLGEAEGIAVTDVSAERVRECRARMPSLEHRRWSVVPRKL